MAAAGEDPIQRQVRERAYALWEREGRPHGRDRDHWLQAEREMKGAKAPTSAAIPSAGRMPPGAPASPAKAAGAKAASKRGAAKASGDGIANPAQALGRTDPAAEPTASRAKPVTAGRGKPATSGAANRRPPPK